MKRGPGFRNLIAVNVQQQVAVCGSNSVNKNLLSGKAANSLLRHK
jgi:hypothetical protein